jgi:hypothetical protein
VPELIPQMQLVEVAPIMKPEDFFVTNQYSIMER